MPRRGVRPSIRQYGIRGLRQSSREPPLEEAAEDSQLAGPVSAVRATGRDGLERALQRAGARQPWPARVGAHCRPARPPPRRHEFSVRPVWCVRHRDLVPLGLPPLEAALARHEAESETAEEGQPGDEIAVDGGLVGLATEVGAQASGAQGGASHGALLPMA